MLNKQTKLFFKMDFKLQENDALNVLSTITGLNTELINSIILSNLIENEIIYNNAEMSLGLNLEEIFNRFGVDDSEIKGIVLPNVIEFDEEELNNSVKGLRIVGLYFNDPKGCENCGCELEENDDYDSRTHRQYKCNNEVCEDPTINEEYDPYCPNYDQYNNAY